MQFEMFLRDRFDKPITDGTYLDVQNLCGKFKVRYLDGDLYFEPYGKLEKVRDYFKDDLEVIE